MPVISILQLPLPILQPYTSIMSKHHYSEEDLSKQLEENKNLHKLILYNDDVNTFDFVIESLVDVCGHNLIQAEQCTMLVHYKGRCAVKEGSYQSLRPLCEALLDRGLSSVIE